MIHVDKTLLNFHLQTKHTSYIMRVLPSKHLGCVYYGDKLDDKKPINHLEAKDIN